ncbi:hypothetical protein ACFQ9X_09940 [Catenulispora yoronensis]
MRAADLCRLDHLGGLTHADIPKIVRVLADIADNTEPQRWDYLLSREQEQPISRASQVRRQMDADRPALLPELTGNALESLLVAAGLTRYGLISAGPRHIDLIVETAIEAVLLPNGSVLYISQSPSGCRLHRGTAP